jgi:hypothetical protein
LDALARGVNGLIEQMRREQQMLRDWVEAQARRSEQMDAALKQFMQKDERR